MTLQYFAGCTTLETAHERYRAWAKQLHPDHGGSAEAMRAMQAEYEAIRAALELVGQLGGVPAAGTSRTVRTRPHAPPRGTGAGAAARGGAVHQTVIVVQQPAESQRRLPAWLQSTLRTVTEAATPALASAVSSGLRNLFTDRTPPEEPNDGAHR